MNQPKNIFVFVVCGNGEHIDTLHYSLRALKLFTKNEIIVVTDTSRNQISIHHHHIIDIKTPIEFNHHQASIYLKTGLNKFLPAGNNYCYLDTDVIALDTAVNEIFNEFKYPIVFAADHCVMDKFSPSAINCGCVAQYYNWEKELLALFKKYEHLIRPPENEQKKEKLLLLFNEMKKNRIKYAYTSLRFWLSARKFTLHQDAYFDKAKRTWFDKNHCPILYEKYVSREDAIESTTGFRFDVSSVNRWSIDGKDVFDCRCNHLQQQIADTFNIQVTDPKWQHWNGGVFVFNDQSHAFLDAWHHKTLAIFKLPEWKTRDQGTLIATAWQFNLQHHAVLPAQFNLIADYNDLKIQHKGNISFYIDLLKKDVTPHFIHVYHHWADKKWDVWQAVEKQTGITFP